VDEPTYWLDEHEYRYVFSRVPRLCVDLILITDEGIVLVKRNQTTWNKYWHIPGGSVMYDESIKEALKRICDTELGITAILNEEPKVAGYAEYDETKQRGYGKSKSLVFYARSCKPFTVKINDNGEQIKVFKKLPKRILEEQKEWLEKNNLCKNEKIVI